MTAELLQEYKEALKQTRKLKEKAPEEDLKTIKGIISSLEFSIQWMETGWMPGYLKRRKKRLEYGIKGYWDDDVEMFVNLSAYKDSYEEVEVRIDTKLKVNRHGINAETTNADTGAIERRANRRRSFDYFNRINANRSS